MLPKTFIVKSLTEKNGGSENGNGKASNGKESNGKVKNGKDSNGNAANGNGKHHDDESPEIGDWYCNICDKTVTDHYVQKLIIHIGKDLNAMEKGSSDACLR